MGLALQKINETYFKGKLEFQPQFTSEEEPSTMSAVIVAPIIEELLFTYFPIAVFNAYKRSWGDMYNKSPTLQAVANLIPVGSSILFGLAHTLVPGYNFPTKLLLFLATTPNNFMRIQYLKRYPENTAVPLLNHMLNNAVSVILTKIYSKK